MVLKEKLYDVALSGEVVEEAYELAQEKVDTGDYSKGLMAIGAILSHIYS